VREALFNILGQDLSGLVVWDLFAGTGSLGLEALSRGASSVVFLEEAPSALRLIRKNLTLCRCEALGVVVKWDLRKGFPRGQQFLQRGFDLAFLDPPYGRGLVDPLLKALIARVPLGMGCRIVVETGKEEGLPTAHGGLVKVDTRIYGDTKVTFYEYEIQDGLQNSDLPWDL
jgi:16S rRNA (guanine966-N2)-methyltransferase